MKINKLIFYISMIINLLLLIISTILYFNFKEDYTFSYIVSILLNVFAGSVILSISSLVNYFIYRRYLLRDIMNECLKYAKIFSKLEYFEPKKYIEEDFDYIKENNKNKLIDKYKKDLDKKNKANLLLILKEYITISEISTLELWNMYDDLDFITDIKNKKKKEYRKKIFNYISYNISIIKEYSYHFKIYISSKNGNYKINEKKLLDLQDKIFFYDRFNYNNYKFKDIISKIKTDYQIIAIINSDDFILIYNKIEDYLLKMFDIVGKDNYFNKNYSGVRK